MKWKNNAPRNIWLIGASSGIGLALSEKLLKQGHRVAMSARRTASLGELAAQYPDQECVAPCDVTDMSAVRNAVARIQKRFGHIDTLIFNAGICEYIDHGDVKAERVARVMNTNFIGLANVVEASTPLIKAHSGAQLAAVSSSAAFVPLPRAEAYGASKAAMTYFMHTLRLGLQPKGISVNVICPGFVKTPLTDKNDFEMPFMVTAEEAADEIIDGLRKDKREIHFPRRFTRLLKLIAALPLSLQQRLTGSLVKA